MGFAYVKPTIDCLLVLYIQGSSGPLFTLHRHGHDTLLPAEPNPMPSNISLPTCFACTPTSILGVSPFTLSHLSLIFWKETRLVAPRTNGLALFFTSQWIMVFHKSAYEKHSDPR